MSKLRKRGGTVPIETAMAKALLKERRRSAAEIEWLVAAARRRGWSDDQIKKAYRIRSLPPKMNDPTETKAAQTSVLPAVVLANADSRAERHNLEVLVAADHRAIEAIQAVTRSYGEIIKKTLEQTSTAIREAMAAGSSSARETEPAMDAFERAMADMRELARMASEAAEAGSRADDERTRRAAESLEELVAKPVTNEAGAPLQARLGPPLSRAPRQRASR